MHKKPPGTGDKRIRYKNGRVIDFPEGSNWRDVWEEIRNVAFLRRVTVGTITLEAYKQYLGYDTKSDDPLPLNTPVHISGKNKTVRYGTPLGSPQTGDKRGRAKS